MKKYLLAPFISAFVVGFFTFAGISNSSAYYNTYQNQTQGASCASYYHPVCGEKSGNQEVYQNICTMNSSGATFVQWKTCGYSSGNNYSNYFSNNYSNNYVNTWQYQQPQYVRPTYVARPVCSQNYSPVCALKDGYKKSYSNACFARQNGAQFLNTGACVNTYTQYQNQNNYSQNYTSNYSQQSVYYRNNSNRYNNNTYYHENSRNSNTYYHQNNTPSISISRSQNHSSASLSPNTVFTMNVYAGETGSTITHLIPEGIELLYVTKGSCQKTKVYGGTRLKCHNTDTLQYKAKTSYNTCQKKFTTTFSNYNYNNLSRNFILTVR